MIVSHNETEYLRLVNQVRCYGEKKDDRTGTGTISLFRPNTMRFKLNDGRTFPLLTTKYVNFKAIVKELLWFISGSTNVNDLDSKIWNEWADNNGDLGPLYGKLFRNLEFYDPLKEIINQIKCNPNSRRLVLSTWRHELLPINGNTPDENVKLGKQTLAPCHGTTIQFYVRDNKLSLATYQRSMDVFLGAPFNIASYSLLLMMVARLTGYEADELIYDAGDAHIYNDHIEQIDTQLSREVYDCPSVKINGDFSTIDDFSFDNFELLNYNHHKSLKGRVSI